MRSSQVLERQLSVAIPGPLNRTLLTHLLRSDGQEDLAFALWTPSEGRNRQTALINVVVLPARGDRAVHGNVSFYPQYFERVLGRAMETGRGVSLLHSHLGPGWQDMSSDDKKAEASIAEAASSLTGLPLFGLTLGTDGVWSG